MTGQISLLVSRDFQALTQAAQSLEPEVAKQLHRHTRANAEPLFKDEVNSRTRTQLQSKVLGKTARVAVSRANLTLKAAHIGKTSSGALSDELKGGAEFGGKASKVIRSRSSRGRVYRRRLGKAFGPNIRAGKVFFPSVEDSIPRVGALWFQTAYRTVAETFEKVGG